jgi:hypothetical protein
MTRLKPSPAAFIALTALFVALGGTGYASQGNPGAPGRDGGVAARVRASAAVDTPTDGSKISIPLSGADWTQGRSELDQLPFGQVTYTAPAGGCSGTGFVLLTIQVTVGSTNFDTVVTTIPDGETRTTLLDAPSFLFEPGVDTVRAAEVTVWGGCELVDSHPKFTVDDLRFDVLRAT